MENPTQNIQSKEFVRLLTIHHPSIYAYIVSLVANFNDADDIMQETTSNMWEQFERFEPGTNFVAWGNKIAYYKVLELRRKKQRDKKNIVFSEETFKKFAENVSKHGKDHTELVQKLRDCISKLQPGDINLIKLRYLKSHSAQEISRRLHKSIRSIYYSISRIQGLLLKCMQGEGR